MSTGMTSNDITSLFLPLLNSFLQLTSLLHNKFTIFQLQLTMTIMFSKSFLRIFEFSKRNVASVICLSCLLLLLLSCSYLRVCM